MLFVDNQVAFLLLAWSWCFGICETVEPISSDKIHGYIMWWLMFIVPSAQPVPSYSRHSTVWHIHMTSYVTFDVFSRYSGIIFCILRVLNSALLLLDLLYYLYCLRRFVRVVCHMYLCRWQHKAVNRNGVWYPSFISCWGMRLNTETFYDLDVRRKTFALSTAFCLIGSIWRNRS